VDVITCFFDSASQGSHIIISVPTSVLWPLIVAPLQCLQVPQELFHKCCGVFPMLDRDWFVPIININ
jgi:hypothetical protein